MLLCIIILKISLKNSPKKVESAQMSPSIHISKPPRGNSTNSRNNTFLAI